VSTSFLSFVVYARVVELRRRYALFSIPLFSFPSPFGPLIPFCPSGFSLFYFLFFSSVAFSRLQYGSMSKTRSSSFFMLFLFLLLARFFISSSIEDATLLGSLQNGIHVIQDQDQRAQWTFALQQRSPTRTGLFVWVLQ
jgi:hypothetical protein